MVPRDQVYHKKSKDQSMQDDHCVEREGIYPLRSLQRKQRECHPLFIAGRPTNFHMTAYLSKLVTYVGQMHVPQCIHRHERASTYIICRNLCLLRHLLSQFVHSNLLPLSVTGTDTACQCLTTALLTGYATVQSHF